MLTKKQRLAHKAFYTHKHDAKRRGISFRFSRDEWIRWWFVNLGFDWLNKRGRKKGQCVMSRFGDLGAYEWDNVECLTCSSNQGQLACEDHPRATITDNIARRIYLA